jgi:hypothetical protein
MSLYENIHNKRKRIKAGSGERMRKKGASGAPSDKDFKDAAKTAKDFTPCKGCPTRGACKKAGKCLMKSIVGK